jgi:hypothetical protein
MIYKSKDGDIDLSGLVRLYPAGVVDAYGEIAEMSLEWCEMNEDRVKIQKYVLVFDFTQPNQDVKNRVVLSFKSQNELIDAMQEVSDLITLG